MDADHDLPAIRRWLLVEARGLQQQQEETRRRLEAVRSIMRLVKAYEDATRPAAKEASS
jgi:hypothetical protein